MKTIQELALIVNAGNQAQAELNQIAKSIYDLYVSEVRRETVKLKEEFPSFDDRVSELLMCNEGFHRYYFTGNSLVLIGEDYFRGETNHESDQLPMEVFVDDPKIREKLVKEFVQEKFNKIRNQLKEQEKAEEESARQEYELLKERFDK